MQKTTKDMKTEPIYNLVKNEAILFTGTSCECRCEGQRIEYKWEPFPPPFNKYRNPEYQIVNTETGENII